MQLLYPIGLLALAGLVIPVLIHLWNIKKGKTLKIGSIALLGESAKASSKSWHIKDWPLFIIRCLLLILIAFLLAQPVWQQKKLHTQQKGWILLEKGQFQAVYQSQKQLIDSLLKLGFELHDFNVGFNLLKLQDSATVAEPRQLSYTSLIKQLNSQLSSNFPVYLFSTQRLNDLDGPLPTIAFQLNWKKLKTSDTLKNWTSTFAGKSYEAKSTPAFTSYQALAEAKNVPAIEVLIHDPKGTDRKYVQAALNAIADFTKRKINTSNWDNYVGKPASLGFWLSDQAIDPSHLSKLKKGANLLTYVKGKIHTTPSTLILNEGNGAGEAEIQLQQYVMAPSLSGQLIWTDGAGNALLSKETKENYQYYRFYSRFNPQWTDLVWNEQFVKALMPIVYGDQEAIDFGFETHPTDQRQWAAGQKQVLQGHTAGAVLQHQIITPLQQWFWLLAFLVLIIERILSFSKQKKLSHVKS